MQYDIELEELANRLEREGEMYAAQALRAIAAVRRCGDGTSATRRRK